MPDQCYFTGANGKSDFYQCLTPTVPGQSPATAPANWSVIGIPARFRWVLAHLTYANLLEMDGQKDKATAERTLAIEDDRRGLEVMIITEANRESFLGRPSVQTPLDPLGRSNIFYGKPNNGGNPC